MGESKDNIKAPIFGISRLRMGTDGPGITTLVTFMGCHLKCKYCINPKCHEPIYEADGTTLRKGVLMLTPRELYDRVKIDNIYFQATGGGICFGGGEPGLHYEFIQEFKRICDPTWKLTIETALGYPNRKALPALSKIINTWIVDMKDLSDTADYVGIEGHFENAWQQLGSLRHLGLSDKEIIVKIPYIPGFQQAELKSDFLDWCSSRSLKVIKTKYLTPDEQKDRKRKM